IRSKRDWSSDVCSSDLELPERMVSFLLERVEVEETTKCGNIQKDTLLHIIQLLKNFTFDVHGSLSIEKAFVTGGGVSTKEIVPSTMGSKLMERLYFCGEILDIYDYTDGYNITSALVTGRLNGTNVAYQGLAYILFTIYLLV